MGVELVVILEDLEPDPVEPTDDEMRAYYDEHCPIVAARPLPRDPLSELGTYPHTPHQMRT